MRLDGEKCSNDRGIVPIHNGSGQVQNLPCVPSPDSTAAAGRKPTDLQQVSSRERFQVWLYHPRHPADFRGHEEFVHRGFPLPVAVAQRFQSDVQPYLVAVLETIGDSLCRTKYSHGNSLEFLLLDAIGKGFSGKMHNTHQRIIRSWATSIVGNRYPNLTRRLRSEPVEAQGREQADDTMRYALRCLHERMVLGHPATIGHIKPSADLSH